MIDILLVISAWLALASAVCAYMLCWKLLEPHLEREDKRDPFFDRKDD